MVFCLLLVPILAPLVSSNSELPEEVVSLPNVSWQKDLDAGYLSTAPLIEGGMVIIKAPENIFH